MTTFIDARDETAVSEATRCLDAGNLVAYPAGGRYALGGDALDEDAVARVLDVADRPQDAGVSVVVPDLEAARHVVRVTPAARRLGHLLPGPVTLLLPAAATAPENLHDANDRVAVRVPPEPFARALAAHFGPVTAPRATRGHGAPPRRPEDARAALGDALGLVVGDAAFADAPAATVVDATGPVARVVKAGALPADAVDLDA